MKRRSTAARKLDEVIVERVLELDGARHGVRIRIFRPEPDPRSERDWRCLFEVAGIPRRSSLLRYTHGVDPMQALMLTFQHLYLELRLLQDDGVPLRWLGSSELGIPWTGKGEPSMSEYRRMRRTRAPAGARKRRAR